MMIICDQSRENPLQDEREDKGAKKETKWGGVNEKW